MNAVPVRYEALGLTGNRLRQARRGFIPITEYLQVSKDQILSAQRGIAVGWEPFEPKARRAADRRAGPKGDAERSTSDPSWVRLVDSDASTWLEGQQAIDAFFDKSIRSVVDGIQGNASLTIRQRDYPNNALLLDRTPSNDDLTIRLDKRQIERQLGAIERLQDQPHPDLMPLLELVLPLDRGRWSDVTPARVDQWRLLTESGGPGVNEQRRFVEIALATDDFALLEGPPGSGKTTAICELILQVIARGGRVLLCASTHAAVDNALERIVGMEPSATAPIIAVRVGDEHRTAPSVHHLLIDERVKTERQAIAGHLGGCPDPTLGQERLLAALDRQPTVIDRLVLDAANLVCGTMIGILAHPDLGQPGKKERAPAPAFDLMIVDEASKTPFQEFLVPAVLARRWVLVGDRRQLSPYADQKRIEANLRPHLVSPERTELREEDASNESGELDSSGGVKDRSADLAWRLSAAYQYRQSQVPPSLQRKIDGLMLGFDAAGVEQVRAVAFPSVLESLQQGLDGSTRAKRYPSVLTCGLPSRALGSRHVLLTHQHRMHPEISQFAREHVYNNNALHDADDMVTARSWSYPRYPSRIEWFDVQRNVAEAFEGNAAVVASEIGRFRTWLTDHRTDRTSWHVAALAFVNEQRVAIEATIGRAFGEGPSARFNVVAGTHDLQVDVSTVDSYQGREADVVFLATGKPWLTHFSRSPNRVNVALTRARFQLVVVGNHSKAKDDDSLLGQLAKARKPSRVVGGTP